MGATDKGYLGYDTAVMQEVCRLYAHTADQRHTEVKWQRNSKFRVPHDGINFSTSITTLHIILNVQYLFHNFIIYFIAQLN